MFTLFFKTLYKIKSKNIDFKLVVLGEEFANSPPIFEEAKEKFEKGEFGDDSEREEMGMENVITDKVEEA